MKPVLKKTAIGLAVLVALHGVYWGGIALVYHSLYQKRLARGGITAASLALSGYPAGWQWTWQQPAYVDQSLTINGQTLQLDIDLWRPFHYRVTAGGPVMLETPTATLTLTSASLEGQWRNAVTFDAEDGIVHLKADSPDYPDIHLDRVHLAWVYTPEGVHLDSFVNHITLATGQGTEPQATASSIDKIIINGLITGPDPFSTTPAEWQQQKGQFNLAQFFITSGAMTIDGKGQIGLSPALNPDGEIRLNLRGWPLMIQQAVETGRLNKTQATMMQMGFSLFARKNPDGEPVVETTLVLADGVVRLAGIPLGRVPAIRQEKQ